MVEAPSLATGTIWWVGRQQDTRISKLSEDTHRVFLAQIVSYFWKTKAFQGRYIWKYNSKDISYCYHSKEFDWKTVLGMIRKVLASSNLLPFCDCVKDIVLFSWWHVVIAWRGRGWGHQRWRSSRSGRKTIVDVWGLPGWVSRSLVWQAFPG